MRRSKSWQVALALVWIPVAVVVLSRSFSSAGAARAAPRIEVSLSERRLTLYDGGERVKSYAIAIGKPSHPTPTGTFSVSRIVWNPGWVPPDREWARGEKPRAPGERGNPMQGVKIYFREPAYYIHGTNSPASIGEAASHGCIRMQTSEAVDLARRLMEMTGAGRDDGWYRRVTSGGSSTEVRLPRSVAMIIRN